MSQMLSPVIAQNANTAHNTIPNNISILSAMTPVQPRSSAQPIQLPSSTVSSARLTGLVSPTASIIPAATPASVPQTVDNPAVIPLITTQTPFPRSSPNVSMITPGIPIPRMSPNVPAITAGLPTRKMSPRVSMVTPSGPVVPVMTPIIQSRQSPTARSALLNLTTNQLSQPKLSTRTTPTFPVISPVSSSPLLSKPVAEISNQGFEVKNYQGIIVNSSLENELLNNGYAPLSKIVIRAEGGDKRTQYIKAINKKGQKVFVLVDVNGYTTARATDLTLVEAHTASIVPYSLKTGAYNCAGKDVCGVAFECGSDAVCVLSRGSNDLTPKEANFVFVEQNAPAAATLESEGSIMTYPVIRLSEIRVNPDLVLANTDIVTRRLRNTAYTSELQELDILRQSIDALNAAFNKFNLMRGSSAAKLNQTLTQLEQWNDEYIANPPTSDEGKDRYRKLQFNLAHRNEGIATLLRSMKKVADLHADIDVITKEINDITDYDEKEFMNVDYAVSE